MIAGTLIRIIASSLFVFLSLLLPYFHLSRWNRLSAEEALATSFAAASLLFGAVAFITHAFGLHQPLAHWSVLLVLALSVLPNLRHGFARLRDGVSLPFLGFFLALLVLIMTLQAAFPIYIGGFWYFDWWQHFSLSQMYLGRVPHDYLWLGIYNFASRTPLVNLNAAFFLSIIGDDYWVFQIVASVLNSIFMLPAYLLCRRLANGKTAMMMSALLFLSPSLIHNTWYPWPKLFASYFVLLAAYFYLKHRGEDHIPDDTTCVLIFVLIWAGFLAHQSSLFSSIVILLDLFFRALRKEPRRFLLLALACGFCCVVINGVWFAWATSYFGIKQSFLSYYERPATIGGASGYLIVLAYHTMATICSPLFVYDLAGKQFDPLRFFENLQVLYYNSFAGLGTVTVFILALGVLVKRISAAGTKPGYARYALRVPVRGLLLAVGMWVLALALLVFTLPGFGDALFSRHFNHPAFARQMFAAFFLVGGSALVCAGMFLLLAARSGRSAQTDSPRDFAAGLLFWMTVTGYAGGISTHHELYIHGMISAGCATSVLLTVMLLARICSDAPRAVRTLCAVPILCENFLILWLPLLIIKCDWGWASEKNWQLKYENTLVFMADLCPEAWQALAAVGVTVQAAMLAVWILARKEETR
jgi:hypothetical protein